MRSRVAQALLAAAVAIAAGCAQVPMRGLELVPPTDPSYMAADPAGATGAQGEGKVTTPYVVRLTRDRVVYRLWAGPAVTDAEGRTSRIGQWWTFETPKGTLASFRRRYEVCEKWDSLRYVAKCTLKRGAVVVIGPGQSVSEQTCEKPDERYPANHRDFQVYIHNAWTRPDLECRAESLDYMDDPRDIARPAAR
jgi:hypothetical protein